MNTVLAIVSRNYDAIISACMAIGDGQALISDQVIRWLWPL